MMVGNIGISNFSRVPIFSGAMCLFAAVYHVCWIVIFNCHGTIHLACGATGIVGFTGGGVGATFGGPCACNKRNESNLLVHSHRHLTCLDF